jgi:hypothetical protein
VCRYVTEKMTAVNGEIARLKTTRVKSDTDIVKAVIEVGPCTSCIKPLSQTAKQKELIRVRSSLLTLF